MNRLARVLLIVVCSIIALDFAPPYIFNGKNSWEQEGLKGMVKAYTLRVYADEDALSNGTWNFKSVNEFNYHGFLTRLTVYQPKDSVHTAAHFVHIFDEYDRELEMQDLNSGYKYSYMYENNAEGNLVQQQRSAAGKLFITKVYNKDGRQDRLYETDVNGKPFNISIFHYDSKLNVIRIDRFSKNDTLDQSQNFRYDRQGNMTDEFVYDRDHRCTKHTVFRYDNHNNEISRTDSTHDSPHFLVHFPDHVGEMFWGYKGYDEKGNWLMRYNIAKGKPVQIWVRQIEYY